MSSIRSVDEPDERRWAVEPYDDDQRAAELRSVADAPGFAIRDDSELSIAGLQNKLLVCALDDGGWGRPVNGRPSTHIMKLDDGRHNDLLWPTLRPTAAMSINSKHKNVTRHDFVTEARRWGFALSGADRLIDDLAVRLLAAAADCHNDRVASLVTERLHTIES